MINYIKSEVYRTLRNRNLALVSAIGTIISLAGIVLLKYMIQIDASFRYGNTKFALSNIYYQMFLTLIATVVIAGFMHDGEDKQHTIKHSVAFGIKRSNIYLGRLITQFMVTIVLYVVVVSMFTALSFALLKHSNQGELDLLIQISVASITCLGAGLAATHYFLMTSENEIMANLKAVSFLWIIPVILNMVGRKIAVIQKMADLFPYNAVDFSSLINGEVALAWSMIHSLLIGLGWIVFFAVMGLLKYQKKEVI